MARSIEIVSDGSYARRIETCGGTIEADVLRKVFPPEIPPGKRFVIRWLNPLACEYGIETDPTYTAPTVAKTVPGSHKQQPAVMSDSKLKERAAELGIETKGRTREAIQADVEKKEAA